MNRKPLVHIVDDEKDLRESLRMLLESVDIEAVCHPDAECFLAAYDAKATPDRPMCLLLDVRLPKVSGMSLLEHLRRQNARLPVIMLTGYGDITMSVNAMKLGAADFVTKPFNHQDLLDRIQDAVRNPRRSVESEGIGIDPYAARQRWNTLTPREQQICTRITRGSPNKLIAYELGISVRTVESHRARIMEKLKARTVVDLVQQTLSVRPHD